MDSRNNVIAMMVLGAGIVALGGSILSGEIFKAEKPEKPGYVVEGVEAEAGAGAPVAEVPIATLLASADAAKGADVFKKCASCHTVTQGGANGIGPNLWGTLGEEIGKGKGGYAFSEALSGKGGKWDFESMNAWLHNPKAFAPGTKMSFAGLSKGEDRANILAYLNSQGSNLPLPAAPAAPAAGAEQPEGTTPAENTPTPPGGPQPGGTSQGTATPATKPNT
jgi:cytochrome c